MKPFNEANLLIHDLLVQECIWEIDLDDTRIEQWLYQSTYPLSIPKQDGCGTYYFNINLYQWEQLSQSLNLITLKYKYEPLAQIAYISNTNISDSQNQLGKRVIESERFLNHIKPYIIQGFREIALKDLLESD